MMTMRRRTMMGAASAPALEYEAFVAPVNFNPDAQELNIISVFASFADVNKKYIMLISSAVASTTLPSVSGITYYYSQNGGTYTGTTSGTITWTAGSNKRNVIVVGNTITVSGNSTCVWIHCSSVIERIGCSTNTLLKYITLSENKIKYISDFGLYNCPELTGNIYLKEGFLAASDGGTTFPFINSAPNLIGQLTIPSTFIGRLSIINAGLSGELVIPNTVTLVGTLDGCKFTSVKIGTGITTLNGTCARLNFLTYVSFAVTYIYDYTFYGCSSLARIDSKTATPPTIQSGWVFSGVNKSTCVVHCPAGSYSAYRAASQWSGFTTIIDDL